MLLQPSTNWLIGSGLAETFRVHAEPMTGDVDLAAIGRLLGEPSRAQMCLALMHGRFSTAGELAAAAGIAPSTASEHLSLLVAGGLLDMDKQGRHRYFRLKNHQVAEALEALIVLAPAVPVTSLRQSQQAKHLRAGRTCYDHLAGGLGMAVTDMLMAAGVITESFGVGDLAPLTPLQLDIPPASGQPILRPCVDWTERRHHAAGSLPAALTRKLFELGWVSRTGRSRGAGITAAGVSGLADLFPAAPQPARDRCGPATSSVLSSHSRSATTGS